MRKHASLLDELVFDLAWTLDLIGVRRGPSFRPRRLTAVSIRQLQFVTANAGLSLKYLPKMNWEIATQKKIGKLLWYPFWHYILKKKVVDYVSKSYIFLEGMSRYGHRLSE